MLNDLIGRVAGHGDTLREFADRLEEAAEGFVEELREVAERADRFAGELADANGTATNTGNTGSATGSKIGLRDRNGKNLRVGDLVRFTGSTRYGSGNARVTGVAGLVSEGSDKDRVALSLVDGRNNSYRAGVDRVARIERFDGRKRERVAVA